MAEYQGAYKDQAWKNVSPSDGTICFAFNWQSLGEKPTANAIRNYQKLSINVEFENPLPVGDVVDWVKRFNINILNVAGNCQPKGESSKGYGITTFVKEYLAQVFEARGLRGVQKQEANGSRIRLPPNSFNKSSKI